MTELTRIRRDYLRRLKPGEEYWEDTPHHLAARVRRERNRGRIAEVSRWEILPGRHAVIVKRLKNGPPPRRVAALWLSGGTVAGGAATVATWWVATHLEEVAAAVLLFIAVAGGLAILTRVLTGHRARCVGLHCPGCRH